MSISFVSLSPAVALVAALLVDAVGRVPAAPAGADARAVEVQRIRAHFDSVLAELPGHDIASLSRAQRANRSRLLGTLRAYRDAGAFPHNYDFPDRPTRTSWTARPVCAAPLRTSSHRPAAATSSIGWRRWTTTSGVPQLAGDTAFTQWLSDNGLTLDEAARIQIPYMGEPMPDVGVEPRSNSSAYTIASAVAVGGSIATSLWTTRGNADGTAA